MQPQRLVDDRSALDRPDGRGGVRLHGSFGHLLARCRDFPPLRVAVDPVDLAHVLGIERPKVAVLSAIEVVDPAITAAIGGEADILLVPNLEAGNILYKSLTHLARADVAGIVLARGSRSCSPAAPTPCTAGSAAPRSPRSGPRGQAPARARSSGPSSRRPTADWPTASR